MTKTAKQFIKEKNEKYSKQKERFLKLKEEKRKIPMNLLIGMKDIGRKARVFFVRLNWKFIEQNNLDKKVFVVEKLQKYSVDKKHKLAYPNTWIEGDIEYRIGYYIVDKIGQADNRWIWGQFCPLIPDKDVTKIIKSLKSL